MTGATVTFSLARDSLQAHEPSPRLTRFRRRGYQRYLMIRSQVDLYFFWERRWFFITLLLGLALMLAPTPPGLTHPGQIVLAMSAMATMLFVTEAVPLQTVPLLIIIGEVLLLKTDPTARELELPARIAQLIPRPIVHFAIESTDQLTSTQRGAGDFKRTARRLGDGLSSLSAANDRLGSTVRRLDPGANVQRSAGSAGNASTCSTSHLSGTTNVI